MEDVVETIHIKSEFCLRYCPVLVLVPHSSLFSSPLIQHASS